MAAIDNILASMDRRARDSQRKDKPLAIPPSDIGFEQVIVTSHTQPVSILIETEGAMAYLRKLAGHRLRVRREEERLKAESKRPANDTLDIKERRTKILTEGMTILPGLKWGDVAVLNCRGCSCSLLGPSFEYLRRKCQPKIVKKLPKAAVIIDSKPFCAECSSVS